MSNPRLALLVGTAFLLVAVPLSASSAQVSLVNECPQLVQAAGCHYLLEFGTDGIVNLPFDNIVKHVDSQGDVLVGIQNNSGSNKKLAGYIGPDNSFSGIHLTGGHGDGKSTNFEWADLSGNDKDQNEKKDCDDKDWDGKSCSDGGSGFKSVTPEPGSILLLGTGLVVLGGVLRRKLLP